MFTGSAAIDKDLIPSSINGNYLLDSSRCTKTPSCHTYSQVKHQSSGKSCDVKLLNTHSQEYRNNPGQITTLFLQEAIHHYHLCYTDSGQGISSRRMLEDLQYEEIKRADGFQKIRLGIVMTASYPADALGIQTRIQIQEQKNGQAMTDERDNMITQSSMNIEKMIKDVANELNTVSSCTRQSLAALLKALRKRASTIKYVREADRFLIDNWTDLLNSGASSESVFLSSTNSVRPLSIEEEKEAVFELGLLALSVAGVPSEFCDSLPMLKNVPYKAIYTNSLETLKLQLKEYGQKESATELLLLMASREPEERPTFATLCSTFIPRTTNRASLQVVTPTNPNTSTPNPHASTLLNADANTPTNPDTTTSRSFSTMMNLVSETPDTPGTTKTVPESIAITQMQPAIEAEQEEDSDVSRKLVVSAVKRVREYTRDEEVGLAWSSFDTGKIGMINNAKEIKSQVHAYNGCQPPPSVKSKRHLSLCSCFMLTTLLLYFLVYNSRKTACLPFLCSSHPCLGYACQTYLQPTSQGRYLVSSVNYWKQPTDKWSSKFEVLDCADCFITEDDQSQPNSFTFTEGNQDNQRKLHHMLNSDSAVLMRIGISDIAYNERTGRVALLSQAGVNACHLFSCETWQLEKKLPWQPSFHTSISKDSEGKSYPALNNTHHVCY